MKFLALIITLMLSGATLFAQTAGTLTVSTSTSSAGGNYAPRNIIAIWIEDSDGNFVKTLLSYAQTRRTHLNNWQTSTNAAGSEYNTVDAITGSTRSNHATRTCFWDGTNVDGDQVADGLYQVRMELTDKNSTGNLSSFSFEKGGDPLSLTPSNQPSFAAISIEWVPETSSINDPSSATAFSIYPNPTNGPFTVKVDQLKRVEIWNSAGFKVYEGCDPFVDFSEHHVGIYFIKVTTDKGSLVRKLVIN